MSDKPFRWLPDDAWTHCKKLSSFAVFDDLIAAMAKDEPLWKSWVASDSPEECSYPPPYTDLTNPFHKLMLLRFRIIIFV